MQGRSFCSVFFFGRIRSSFSVFFFASPPFVQPALLIPKDISHPAKVYLGKRGRKYFSNTLYQELISFINQLVLKYFVILTVTYLLNTLVPGTMLTVNMHYLI